MSTTKEYQREYYQKHREELLAKKRKKFLTDAGFAERQRERSRVNVTRSRQRQRLDKQEGLVVKEKRVNLPGAPRWYRVRLGEEEVTVRMYHVGGLAALLGRKRKTLQMWERDGVLPEAMFRDAAQRRMYTEDQVEALVGAMQKVMAHAKGHAWLPALRGAFHQAWKTLPRGVKEKRHGKDDGDEEGTGWTGEP